MSRFRIRTINHEKNCCNHRGASYPQKGQPENRPRIKTIDSTLGKISYALAKKVIEELDTLIKRGILFETTEPSGWIRGMQTGLIDIYRILNVEDDILVTGLGSTENEVKEDRDNKHVLRDNKYDLRDNKYDLRDNKYDLRDNKYDLRDNKYDLLKKPCKD